MKVRFKPEDNCPLSVVFSCFFNKGLHQGPCAAAGLRIDSHGTETDVFIHPPHIYENN